MKISDLLRLSFDNLRRRKGRTILTVAGVVIGACSIIMMVSIGVALDKSYDEMLSGMGDLTTIEVYKWGSNGEDDLKLNDATVDSFNEMKNVLVATPIYNPNVSFSITSGSNDKYVLDWVNIQAIRREAMEAYGYEILEGRFPTGKEKTYVALAGEYLAYNFVNSRKQWPNNQVQRVEDENGNYPEPFVDLMGDKFTIKATGWNENGQTKTFEAELKFSGVLKGNGSQYQTMYGIVMPIDQVIALEKEYNKLNGIKDNTRDKDRTYSEALVKVTDIKYVDDVEQRIKDLGFSTWSMASMRDEMKKETQVIQLILGALGSIALLVSAIGIANTMTMAIYERTKEIGVMKVLGCELSDIKNMFLAEAAGIGFIGGTVGVIISYRLSFLMNKFAGAMLGGSTVSVIPLWLALFGMGFSTLVGIVSGYVPAVRAVKVTALSAIRHE
ncbi:MAG: ABC transporter permease [Oscillospiraceae bacterium]|nr:ABC transporter permease [Oscillospiraceae bacterium]